MHAAAIRLELRIPAARSLKEKRRVLKALTARLTSAFPVGVGEVDHQDAWQRATLGVALVAAQASHLEHVIGAVQRMVLGEVETELIEMGVAYLEEET